MADRLDPRLTPARPDLAAAHLAGKVEAERFAEARPMRVSAASAPLRREPRNDARLDTEALFGETVDVYEVAGGFAWGQLRQDGHEDGYVGYLPEAALASRRGEPTHRVATLRSYAFPRPDIKSPPVHLLSLGSRLEITGRHDAFLVTAEGLHLWAAHLAPQGKATEDYVTVAEGFLGTPYLWGGRTSLGLDCSALVQLAMTAAGLACPRDSDMQERVGEPVAIEAGLTGLERGDRVHWKGHVGIMLDATRLIHANGFHMRVEIETLRDACDRIADTGGGEITAIRRSGRP